jgi:hypothetical protein
VLAARSSAQVAAFTEPVSVHVSRVSLSTETKSTQHLMSYDLVARYVHFGLKPFSATGCLLEEIGFH